MFARILRSQTKTITFAAFVLAVSGIVSKILGLVRDRLLAGYFGAGEISDMYFAAFRIPDFVFGIFIMGGITAAFLPIFSEFFEKQNSEDNKDMWSKEVLTFVNNVLNSFLLLLIVVSGLLALFTPLLIHAIIPGFSPENKATTVLLTRIMFLSPVLFGISSILSGVLHYFNRFLVYSLAPILYNLGIIVGIVFFFPAFGIVGLAYGVILGALLHVLIQIPAARSAGWHYRLLLSFTSPGVKKIFRLMIPRTIGAAAFHINLIVITAIASSLAIGSISVFNYSYSLQYFPIGIIGVSFAISAFPVFSRSFANGRKKEFFSHFSSSLRQILFFTIPITVLMFLLRAQIVRLVLGTGEFGWLATRLTAASLGIFCIGIVAHSVIPLLARAFFSFQDTKTPVAIGLIAMAVNVIFAFMFTFLLKFSNVFSDFFASFLNLQDLKGIAVIGLPLALSLAGVVQAVLLLVFLYKKIGDFELKVIVDSLKKILAAAFLMAAATYATLYALAPHLNMQTFVGVLTQTILASGVGTLVYLCMVWLFRSPEIRHIWVSFLKQFRES